MRIEKIRVGEKTISLLLDEEGKPIIPVAKYMKFLHNRESSSNTLHTYCSSLKQYFTFLNQKNEGYKYVTFDLLSEFVSWLRNPYSETKVVSLNKVKSIRSENTVNLYLTAVVNFYDYLYRNEMIDADIGEKLMKKMYSGSGGSGYKGFLHHVNEGKPTSKNILKLNEPKKRVDILTKEQVERLYESATNIRDQFLIRLLFESGIRIGEALALFTEDIKFDYKNGHHLLSLVDRGELPNGGKLKTGERSLHISQGLMNLYDDYMYEVIGEFNPDHNFLFIKIWGENKGKPMTYSDVYATFSALSKKTGISFHPHTFRHTHGTMYYLQTKDIKMVQERLGHSQIQTTMRFYVHPSDEDIRKNWEQASSIFQLGDGIDSLL